MIIIVAVFFIQELTLIRIECILYYIMTLFALMYVCVYKNYDLNFQTWYYGAKILDWCSYCITSMDDPSALSSGYIIYASNILNVRNNLQKIINIKLVRLLAIQFLPFKFTPLTEFILVVTLILLRSNPYAPPSSYPNGNAVGIIHKHKHAQSPP